MGQSSVKSFFSKHSPKLILGLVLLLAALVRLYRIETKMRFIWDEGRDMMAIRHIIVDKDITLFGPYNEMGPEKDFFGVFHYYLMLPALWLANYNPVGPAILTATLGVISVYLVYRLVLAWEINGHQLALWTAVFYALSPLVVKYSIWPWNPNTMPFFGLVYLLLLRKWFEKKKWWWSGLAGLTLGLLFQLHYFSIALVIPWLLLIFYDSQSVLKKDSRFYLKQLALFGSMFVLANLNFIIFDLTHEWFYFKILKDSFMGGSAQQLFSFKLINFITQPFIFTNDTLAKLLTFSNKLTWSATALFIGLIIKKIKELTTQPEIDLDIMILGSWLGLLLIIGFFPTLVNDYYGSYLWFGLIYIFVRGIIKASQHYGFYWFFRIVGLLFCLRLLFLVNLERAPTWQENLPLVRELSMSVVTDAQDEARTFNIASLAESDTRATRYRYFLEVGGVEPQTINDYQRSEVLYVISPHDAVNSQLNPAWEISSFIDQEWELLASIQGVQVFKVARK